MSIMRKFLSSIPEECFHKILAYTYCPQKPELLSEIRGHRIKIELFQMWREHEIEVNRIFYSNISPNANINGLLIAWMTIYFEKVYYKNLYDRQRIAKVVKMLHDPKETGTLVKRELLIYKIMQKLTYVDIKNMLTYTDTLHIKAWMAKSEEDIEAPATNPANLWAYNPPFSWMYENGKLKDTYYNLITSIIHKKIN